MTREVIFIGLPGPTHSYGGLSGDNVASSTNRGAVSHPQEAALQSIALMRALLTMNLTVGILPPQLRPDIFLLHTRYEGSPDEVIRQAFASDPAFLEKASSSAAMWVANAATITPGVDAADGRTHITPANLHTNLHRRIETKDTARVLAALFGSGAFAQHAPLDGAQGYLDEGAANHMRLAASHEAPGLNVFVYGAESRQSRAASERIAALHAIRPGQVIFVEQHPQTIAKGVFHNDVIAVGNESVLLCHERSFAGGQADIDRIGQAYGALYPGEWLTTIVVPEKELSVDAAVATYFFNSQLITKPDGTMVLVVPQEVMDHPEARKLAERIRADADNPIHEIIALDLRQSMRNGGGPACLRLRAVLTETEIAAIRESSNALVDEAMLLRLEAWARKYYRMQLEGKELGDPALYHECRAALMELGALLRLPVLAPS